MPSSRATVATGRPVLITSFTASSLYSGVNPRRVRPMMNILSYEVSTERGQGQGGRVSGRLEPALRHTAEVRERRVPEALTMLTDLDALESPADGGIAVQGTC